MRKAFMVNDNQAPQQLSDDSLRLTLGSFYFQVMAEVALADVFHRDVNIIFALIPPEKLHKKRIML